MNSHYAVLLTLTMLILDIVMLCITFIYKLLATRRIRRQKLHTETLEHQISFEDIDLTSIRPEELMPIYEKLCNGVAPPKEQQAYLMRVLLDSHLSAQYIRGLSSRSYLKRAESASKLKYLESKEIQDALFEALKKEHRPVVILYLSHALALQHVTKAIGPIVGKLRNINPWYARRIRAILYTFGADFLRYAKRRTENNRMYMQHLLCGFALEYPAEELRDYVVKHASHKHVKVRTTALAALLRHYPEELLKEPFISSTNRQTLAHVIQAYALTMDPKNVDSILAYANYTTLHNQIVQSLTEISSNKPAILQDILARFEHTSSKNHRMILAKVLSNRVDYFLTRINGIYQEQIMALIRELVEARHTSAILFFLNRNRDKNIEDKIVQTLKSVLPRNHTLKAEMRSYLDTRLLARFELRDVQKSKATPKPHSEPPQRRQLAIILISVLTFFPVVILATEFPSLVSMSWREMGALYVVRFNHLLIFYSFAVNSIYLIILVISFRGARIQARLWNIKDYRLLFTKNMLPSVSIIAPAYNETANIIESTESLLNQRYPNFELVVVNDGSKDDTLNTLIDYYNLEKRDRMVKHRLSTRPLRGIYTNKNIPNLIVVDKVNGGKADSLNMGLNIASKEYFCGIDADSLLEPEALLRAVAVMIDSPVESIAVGGNICPVNGCTVERGSLEKISLPKNFIARLQSLEYMRSFMAGRVGWAHINSLLIISGAFGIFNREKTIRTGGYLTKSGRFKRDTVGEDMELVVRLSRQMREKKIPYSVDYAFNANCWTEVPESMKNTPPATGPLASGAG